MRNFTEDEKIDLERFVNLGIVKNALNIDSQKLDDFLEIKSQKSKKGKKKNGLYYFNPSYPNSLILKWLDL